MQSPRLFNNLLICNYYGIRGSHIDFIVHYIYISIWKRMKEEYYV